MNPIALFDKSFLQSLSVDESVWFDHFFHANICPLFYVETLADLGLGKHLTGNRTPDQEVAVIAQKFPEMGSWPNEHHAKLCLHNLLGHEVLFGRIQIGEGKRVEHEGRHGSVFEGSAEAESFERWGRNEFWEIERKFASAWRRSLSSLDLDGISKTLQFLGIDGKSCKSLADARQLADDFVSATDKPLDRMRLATQFLNIPGQYHHEILDGFYKADYPSLQGYAPYAAYVLTVEIFFQAAIASSQISSRRPSNRMDIAYLYYLPFCDIFVSTDNLHLRSAPLFLRKDQEFVWGQDLKAGLKELNEYYLLKVPMKERENGIYSFASKPPVEGDFLVAKIWDRHSPKWRDQIVYAPKGPPSNVPKGGGGLAKWINDLANAPVINPDEIDRGPSNADELILKSSRRRKKGSWYQVPTWIPDPSEATD